MAKKGKFAVKNHVLVSQHVKLSQKEQKELLARLNVSLKELPKISAKDPALEGLNASAGDIIKIARKSPTAGTSVYYRGVISE